MHANFISYAVRNNNLWSCQKVCEALTFLLGNTYIRFGSKLYRKIVGAPLEADQFLFCYESDSMLSLSDINQSEVIETFHSTSRYLDDLLNIDKTSLVAWSIICILQNFGYIRSMSQIPRPHFRTFIHLYLMVLLRLKFMTKETTLILIL